MKKFLSASALLMIGVMISCQTEDAVAPNEISDATLSKISALGFGTDNVQSVDGGYLVEGDILLRDSDLNGNAHRQTLRIAEVEQYHTFNTVTTAPRVITVSTSGTISSELSTALDAALARYNAENLTITFQRVTSGGNINIRVVNTNQYIASAGFPTASGDPHNEIKYARRYSSGYSQGFITTVLAHELGHCIGFRHTDYADRSYSCGGSTANEGSGSVGAVYIPGTPTGPDPNSWMLACLGATTNRPFNNNDKVALNYLY